MKNVALTLLLILCLSSTAQSQEAVFVQKPEGEGVHNWTAQIDTYTLNDGEQVLGRLCLPKEPLRTLVFCIHGTGPNTYQNKRDGFVYFDALADGFCHDGIGFFTYDRRGVKMGTTPPYYDTVDIAKFGKYVPLQEAQDIESMIAQLRKDPKVKNANLILYGISEGTIIATLVADRKNVNPMALLLHGYVNENMFDVVNWQNQGNGLMISLLAAFDKNADKAISQQEYTATDEIAKQYRSALFQDASFDELDVDKNQQFDIADISAMRASFHDYLCDCIQKGEATWIWQNFFRVTPQWFKAHYALEANKSRMLRLNMPISIFHGEEDANVPVEGVYDIAERFRISNKTNLSTFVYPKHNHDLNFQEWIGTGKFPAGLQGVFDRAAEYTTPSTDISQRIWQTDGHCAFTDMEVFNGKYYITFREAGSHIFDKDGKAEGAIRVLVSSDGETWTSTALLQKEGMDLRDPKLSVTPDGRLMLLMGGSVYVDRKLTACLPQVAFSKDGDSFSTPQPITIKGTHPTGHDWLWRVTWQGKTGYGINYFPGGKDGNQIALLKTTDGINYKEVTLLDVDGSPNEATIQFLDDKTMQVMVRREAGNKLGYWGTSRPPYTKWTWNAMPMRLGGPDFVNYNGEVIAGTRIYGKYGDYRTALIKSNGDAKFSECLLFPSGGDTSYPGMLIVGDQLWICYYSSHATPAAAIYLSKIPLKELQ